MVNQEVIDNNINYDYDRLLTMHGYTLEIMDNSWKGIFIEKVLGFSGECYVDTIVTEVTFDKEETIEFDTTGYQLVEDYLASNN